MNHLARRPGLGFPLGWALAMALGFAGAYSFNGFWPVAVWFGVFVGWAVFSLAYLRVKR